MRETGIAAWRGSETVRARGQGSESKGEGWAGEVEKNWEKGGLDRGCVGLGGRGGESESLVLFRKEMYAQVLLGK